MNRMTFFLFAYWHDFRWKKFVGATVKIWDLAHNIAMLGNEVVLFLPKYHFSHNNLPFKVVEVPILDYPLLRLLSFNIFLCVYMFRCSIKISPDIIYVRRMNSVLPALFAKLKKTIFFYEINDDPFRKNYQEGSKVVFFFRSKLSIIQDKFNIRQCDKAFVITAKLIKKILNTDKSLESHKFHLMPSGANTDLLKPLAMHQCRLQLKLREGSKIVGFVGSLIEYQGIDNLIEAASQIIKKVPEAIFLIIGEGPKKDEWISETKKRSLDRHFIFPGHIPYEEVSVWLGATDICLAPFLPSAEISSPVKIFDYMACGKGVVASKINGTTDVFENSGAISFVETENPEMLAARIIDLLTDEKRVQSMGERGRRFILNSYDRKNIAKKVIEEAEKLLKIKLNTK